MPREVNDVESAGFFGHGSPDSLDSGRVGEGYLDVSGFSKVLQLIENGATILVCVEQKIGWRQRRIRGNHEHP
jgi:hypothetical protein